MAPLLHARERVASIEIPAFSLQLLYLEHPAWREAPVVRIAEDRPQARVLEVNERARESGIRPGQRYAQALALESQLCAGVIDDDRTRAAIDELCSELRQFSPDVQADRRAPGCFWLATKGMQLLFKTLKGWCRAVLGQLKSRGYQARIAVGFSRFSSHALARAIRESSHIFATPEDEARALHHVALEHLDIDPDIRDALERLGVYKLGTLLRLPASALGERFGPGVARLHGLARGEHWDPLAPEREAEVFERHRIFDDGIRNTEVILHHVGECLQSLIVRLASRSAAIETFFVDYKFERGQPRHHIDDLRPADPTLDHATLMRLMRLRIESKPPRGAIIELRVSAAQAPAQREQLDLFARKSSANLDAAHEALARIRAEFGNDRVRRARLEEGHLPTAQYRWQPLEALRLPKPTARDLRDQPPGTMLRRIYRPPRPLPPQNRQARDDGWLLCGLDSGPVVRLRGPHIISGAWWAGRGDELDAGIHREYHYVQTRAGQWLWVYYDRRRRRWYLQGELA